MACDGLLTADIAFDCDNGSIAGNEVNAVIINRDDVDLTSTTVNSSNKILLDDLTLSSGKTGYLFQGVKQVNSTAYELVKKDTGSDKYKHIFNGVILNLSAANKLQLQSMGEGGKYVVVVERKWKGASNADAFEVYGLDSGLELNVATYNSNENDATATLELSSADGYEEAKIPYTLLETDYATTKTAFDAKFAAA